MGTGWEPVAHCRECSAQGQRQGLVRLCCPSGVLVSFLGLPGEPPQMVSSGSWPYRVGREMDGSVPPQGWGGAGTMQGPGETHPSASMSPMSSAGLTGDPWVWNHHLCLPTSCFGGNGFF